MRILMLSTRTIHPIDAGFKKRIFHSALALSKKHKIDLLVLDKWNHDNPFPFNNIYEFPTSITNRLWGIATTYPFGHPIQSGYFFNHKALNFLYKKQSQYDIIWINHIRFSPYIPSLKIPFIMDFHDSIALHYLQSRHTVKSMIWKIIYETEYPRLKNMEVNISRKAHRSLTVSHIDSMFIKHNGGRYPVPIPMGVNRQALEEPIVNRRDNIITFIGKLSYLPNKEGLLWYINNIHPILWNKHRYTLVIIGSGKSNIEKDIRDFRGIELRGFVENPYTIMARAKANIAPIFIGAGIQNKVLEGLAVGTPTITTPLGARPIHPKLKNFLYVGNTSKEWITILNYLLNQQTYDNANTVKSLIQTYYSWENIYRKIQEILP